MFNFDDPLADVKSKEVKRACLNELIAALNDTRGLLTEAVCMELVHMVSAAAGLFACPNYIRSILLETWCSTWSATSLEQKKVGNLLLTSPLKKVKAFPYSILSVGPGADPGIQAVSYLSKACSNVMRSFNKVTQTGLIFVP